MQIFTKNGQFIKKIAIRYIDIVAGLAITAQGRPIVHWNELLHGRYCYATDSGFLFLNSG